MIPILYEANETSFTTNGLCRLRDMISCEVVEERNNIYECDFTYPVSGANFELIQCGRIIGVVHDDTNDVQPFDIVSYSKPINGVVSFHAVHVSYRQTGLTVSGTNINTLSSALALLSTATPTNPFSYWTDITSTAYMSAADGTPRSVRQMLGGVEGSILDTYGGEFEWDRFVVKLHKSRGTQVDLDIRYGLNMLNYDEDLDYSGSFTSCIPYWSGDDGNGGTTLVKGNKVDSGLPAFNGIDKCIPLDLSTRFENEPTTAQLESAALTYMTSKNANLPKQTINVDFVRLTDFEEFSQYESLLQCKLCDSINVIFPDYNMSGSFKIVRTVYNVLEERFSSMELGSLSTTLSEALGIGENSSSMSSGGGGSLIYYGECSTAFATAAKTVTVDNSFTLKTGVTVFVKFANYNTAVGATLDVNSTGAKTITRYGSIPVGTDAASSWVNGSVVELLYDGTYWQIVGWLNSIYPSMTEAEYQAGTSTSSRSITPANLKAAIAYWVAKKASLFSSRQASANLTADGQTGVSHFLGTSTMTVGKPNTQDGHLIHMAWDNTGGWDSQLYLENGSTPKLFMRNQSNGTWGNWVKLYSPNDKPTASDIGAVPTTRTVNSKALSSDISLSASDVSALPISGGTLSGGNQIFNCRIANSSSRETTASPTVTGKRGITSFMATGTMTTDRPPNADGTGTGEGTIIHCEWDNTGGWNSQLFIADNDTNNGKPFVAVRGQRSGTWTSWDRLYAKSDFYFTTWVGTVSGTSITFTDSNAANYRYIMGCCQDQGAPINRIKNNSGSITVYFASSLSTTVRVNYMCFN